MTIVAVTIALAISNSVRIGTGAVSGIAPAFGQGGPAGPVGKSRINTRSAIARPGRRMQRALGALLIERRTQADRFLPHVLQLLEHEALLQPVDHRIEMAPPGFAHGEYVGQIIIERLAQR